MSRPISPPARRCPRPRPGELSPERPAARPRRSRAAVQRTGRRVAGGDRTHRPQERRPRRARAHTPAAPAPGPALPVRAPEDRSPRLHGTEGRRDGSRHPSPRLHPLHARGAAEPRTPARQRGGGGRAMRHPEPAGCFGGRQTAGGARRPQPLGAAGVLRRRRTRVRSRPRPASGGRRGHAAAGGSGRTGGRLRPGGARADPGAAQHRGVVAGPRILRADTAAVAVLALVQAVLGDAR